MIGTRNDHFGAAQALLDPAAAREILECVIPRQWMDRPGDVRVERCWPAGNDGLMVEWSFRLGSRRFRLYGRERNGEQAIAEDGDAIDPRPAKHEIYDVLVNVPRWNVAVHSADRDPRMAHLRACLDHHQAAAHVGPLLGERQDRSPRCRLLGYKPGRRGTILFEPAAPRSQASPRILGKTYHNNRASKLPDLHERLTELLASCSDGRTRVLRPRGYAKPMRMALFDWAPGDNRYRSPAEIISDIMGALAALHRASLADVEEFSVEDECAVVQRWQGVLARWRPELASRCERLITWLLGRSGAIDNHHATLIHRDCYERQFVFTGDVTTILDLDTLSLGHPAVDVGNVLAHMLLLHLRAGDLVPALSGLADFARRRYLDSGGRLELEALEFYLVSSMVRLGAVHALRTQTASQVGGLLAIAEHLAHNGLKELD